MAGHAGAENERGSLVDDFRALVHSVIIHPKGPRQGFEIEVKGKLAALVGRELLPQAHCNSGSRVVAGERIEPPTRTIRFWFCSKRYPATGRTDCPFLLALISYSTTST
jgi:hypothetical protein